MKPPTRIDLGEIMTEKMTAADREDEGVAVWLDDMSRARLVSGNLKALVRDKHVVGVTTNPTIFHKAITGTHVYDEQIANLAALDIPVAEAIRLLTTHDVRAVCDLLRPVYDATDGLDGRVSIEVDPGLADDTRRPLKPRCSGGWWTGPT
jgi:transaldolase